MARKRVIYQSEALFVAPSGNSSPTQLSRVQSANYSFDITRQDVNQYGQLALIDRIILEQPTVSLDFTYYAGTGRNETDLGFSLNGNSALASIMSGTSDVKNYYILVSPEGTDANIDTGTAISQGKVIGIGNGYLTSYSVEASVGNIPTVTVNAEALNMKFYDKTTGFCPDINPENGVANTTDAFTIPTPVTGAGITALRPGDVVFGVSGLGVNASDLKIQSFTIATDIGRENVQKLGSRFAFAKFITFPITVTATVEALVGDMAGTDNIGNALSDLVCSDLTTYDLTLGFNNPPATCGGATTKAIQYQLKGAKLDSQEFSSAIGDNKSVTLTFSTQIGGPNDTTKGLFITNS